MRACATRATSRLPILTKKPARHVVFDADRAAVAHRTERDRPKQMTGMTGMRATLAWAQMPPCATSVTRRERRRGQAMRWAGLPCSAERYSVAERT